LGIAASAEFDRHAASLAPSGLDLGRRPPATGDYEAWTPEG
jgi:NADH:ubiquinone oxidoreductase subunit